MPAKSESVMFSPLQRELAFEGQLVNRVFDDYTALHMTVETRLALRTVFAHIEFGVAGCRPLYGCELVPLFRGQFASIERLKLGLTSFGANAFTDAHCNRVKAFIQ